MESNTLLYRKIADNGQTKQATSCPTTRKSTRTPMFCSYHPLRSLAYHFYNNIYPSSLTFYHQANIQLQTMGADCIGRSPRYHNSNHKYQINTPPPPPLQHPILNNPALPPLTVASHQPTAYPTHTHLPHASDRALNRQYRYQDYFQLTSLASKTKLKEDRQEEQYEANWSACTSLDRELFQAKGVNTVITSGASYALVQPNKPEPQSQKADLQNSGVKFHFLPHSVVVLDITLGINQVYSSNVSTHSISSRKDLAFLIQKQFMAKSIVNELDAGFAKGFVFYQKGSIVQSLDHWLLNLLRIDIKLRSFSILLYPNQTETQTQTNHRILIKPEVVPSTYWQLSHLIKHSHTSLWLADLSALQLFVPQSLLPSYVAIQMLRCCLSSLQTKSLASNKECTDSSISYISSFLKLERAVLRQIIFVTQLWLGLQQYVEADRFVEDMVRSIAFEASTLADGIFIEFGLEINEKEHPFRNDPYHFVKFRLQQKDRCVRMIGKQVLPVSNYFILSIIQAAKQLCNNGDKLTPQTIENIQKDLIEQIKAIIADQSLKFQHQIHFRDYLIRVDLLQYSFTLTQGYIDAHRWSNITNYMQSIDYVTAQTAFIYLCLAALNQSAQRGVQLAREEQKKNYLKALEMGLKLFGDPRASRLGTQAEPQQVWLVYLLQNYYGMFKNSTEKLQYNFLKNMAQCLKEDLKKHSQPQNENGNYIYTNDTLIKYSPLRKFSGIMIKRSDIWDCEREASRSTYSDYGSSSAVKRLNKSFYRVNQWEFGLKPAITEGTYLWGQSASGPPQIIPSLKNHQVLSIAAGSYHVVFLTEEGIFGWGQNNSGQLGCHNLQKVYKQPVKVQQININRHKDHTKISCGNQHTALLLNNKLIMWGQSQNGIIAGNSHEFESVACGGLHTLGIKDGRVYSWGRGEGGQLGHPFNILKQEKKEETTFYYLDVPSEVKGIQGTVAKVACGDAHSLVLTAEGRVWVFGFSYQGQLGLGLTGQSEAFQVFEPTELTAFKDPVSDIWAGPTSSFFKTNKGLLLSCGYNDCLQLGIDRVLKILQKKKYLHRIVDLNKRKIGEQQFSKPRKLDIFGEEMGLKLLQLQCGENHCLALAQYQSNQRLLVGWGLNKHCQLDFKLSEVTAPRTLDVLHGFEIRQMCCGSTFSLAVVGSQSLTVREVLEICSNTCQIGKE